MLYMLRITRWLFRPLVNVDKDHWCTLRLWHQSLKQQSLFLSMHHHHCSTTLPVVDEKWALYLEVRSIHLNGPHSTCINQNNNNNVEATYVYENHCLYETAMFPTYHQWELDNINCNITQSVKLLLVRCLDCMEKWKHQTWDILYANIKHQRGRSLSNKRMML